MKKQKINLKNILDRKLSTAIFCVAVFVTVLVVAPSADLVKTVVTKKPAALAAGTCGSSAIFSGWTNDWFTGSASRCDSGTYTYVNTYASYVLYKCGTTTCRLSKSCRVCSYGSGDPCGWVYDYIPTYQPCGGSHISTYNCNSTIGGCGDAFCGPAAGGNFYTGSDVTNAGRCKPNNTYFNVDNNAPDYRFTWQCQGPKGHTIGCGANKAVNGACGASTNTCTAGTFQDTADGTCTYNWNCNGINNGTTAYCSSAKSPTAGSCGASLNTCSSGSFVDTADGSCAYNWQCQGTCAGSTASCSLPKSSTYSCSVAPQSGISPLVIKISPNVTCPIGSVYYDVYFGTSGTTCSSVTSGYTTYTSTPIMYTYPTSGSKKVCYRVRTSSGASSAWSDCGSGLTITKPKSSSGGEVAP